MLHDLERDFERTRRTLEAVDLSAAGGLQVGMLQSAALGTISAVERELSARMQQEERLRGELAMAAARTSAPGGSLRIEHDFLSNGSLGLRLRQDDKAGPLRIKEVSGCGL